MFPPESDRAAQYESLQWTIERNAESIQQLRQENKRLYKRLSEAIAVRYTMALSALVLSEDLYKHSCVPLVSSPCSVKKVLSMKLLIKEVWRRKPTSICQGR